MKDLWDWLDGNKTYIVGAAYVAVSFVAANGWISQDSANEILAVLLGTGLVTLRMGMKTISK